MGRKRYKASVTVFISLGLSSFLLILTLLIRLSIVNAEKERFEIASDISMNSALGEYEKDLYEQYGLLYIDASYLGEEPKIDNVTRQIRHYLLGNTQLLGGDRRPWGSLSVKEVSVDAYRTAAYENGGSMRSQANHYADDSPVCASFREEVDEALPFIESASQSESFDPMEEWSALMEALDGMEKPVITQENGTEREIPLSNPSDWVYGLSGSDLLYAAEIPVGSLSSVLFDTKDLISNREGIDTGRMGRGMDTGTLKRDTATFFTWLLTMMGCFGNEREVSAFRCELEYLISGEMSDYENFRAVAKRIFTIRFVDNVSLAMNDGGLRSEAVAAAELLEICTYDPSFIDPVATSILYACAYLETLSDLYALYGGGRVPVLKDSHHMRVDAVLGGHRYLSGGEEGLTYRQYLLLFLGMMEEGLLNFRVMDILELEVRRMSGNPLFRMDACMERLNADLCCRGSGLSEYRINRTYGYY